MSVKLKHLSTLIGWLYVVLWGVSNYPPIISNWQLHSVQGISIDYMYFNMMGFILYTLYTSTMWGSPLVRREFYDENGLWPLIRLNDVMFGVHNMCTNGVVLSQAYCWGFKRNDNQRLSRLAKVILSIVATYLIGSGSYIYSTQGWEPVANVFNWMHLLTSLGLVKIGMSVCKNIPQIMYNYNRKSTHGWPILMIWLDFLGALLSFVQLLLDAYVAGDMTAVFDNKPKLLLSIQVFIADAIFFVQHYYLYYESDVKQYGPFKADIAAVASGHAYQSIVEEDEEFLTEHAHDHDHLTSPRSGAPCTVSSTNKDELQRLL
jgi:cystinosin